jgi:hypothetical protein
MFKNASGIADRPACPLDEHWLERLVPEQDSGGIRGGAGKGVVTAEVHKRDISLLECLQQTRQINDVTRPSPRPRGSWSKFPTP